MSINRSLEAEVPVVLEGKKRQLGIKCQLLCIETNPESVIIRSKLLEFNCPLENGCEVTVTGKLQRESTSIDPEHIDSIEAVIGGDPRLDNAQSAPVVENSLTSIPWETQWNVSKGDYKFIFGVADAELSKLQWHFDLSVAIRDKSKERRLSMSVSAASDSSNANSYKWYFT